MSRYSRFTQGRYLDYCVVIAVYRPFDYQLTYEVNLREPTGLVIVLPELRLAECVFVRACFTLFYILIIAILVLI